MKNLFILSGVLILALHALYMFFQIASRVERQPKIIEMRYEEHLCPEKSVLNLREDMGLVLTGCGASSDEEACLVDELIKVAVKYPNKIITANNCSVEWVTFPDASEKK